MSDLLAELPSLIRAELTRRGMSQRQLGTELDITSSTITRMMRNQGLCDVPTFVRLCAWLRVAPEEFADELVAKAYRRGRVSAATTVAGRFAATWMRSMLTASCGCSTPPAGRAAVPDTKRGRRCASIRPRTLMR